MTPEERDRLAKLEAYQGEMRGDIKEIKQDVATIKHAHAKAGGVILALMMIAGFFGWLISQIKGFWVQ